MDGLNKISRREFLRRTGQAGGGLVFALTLGSGCSRTSDAPSATVASNDIKTLSPNVYVNVRSDGGVEIVCHRSEMGQGIRTCLPQVIADELDADWDRIELIQGLGDIKYGDQNTDGSTSIRKHFDLLRNAGATARDMLTQAAADQWQVPKDECTTKDHAVHHNASGQTLSYGDLVADAAKLEVPQEVSFKSPGDYRYIGKPVDLIDGFDMSTGQAMYGYDTKLPGMVYGSIERSPVYGGTVKSLDDSDALAVPGVQQVIKLPDPTAPAGYNPLGGVAVLADNTWAALQGRKALKIEWDSGANAEYDSDSYREVLLNTAKSGGTTVLERGNVGEAMKNAVTLHEAEYFAPHLSQAPMEPPAAAAVMTEDGGCEVWACTQAPQAAQNTVAQTLGIDKEKVKINVTLLGGGFGRKSKADFVAEAAWLAQQSGKPVKVSWTREDDIQQGYLHSVSAQCIKAGLDADGNAVAWEQCTTFPTISSTFDPSAVAPSAGELSLGCTDNPCEIPNMKITAGEAKAHLRIGWLRSVCNIFHAFSSCSFMDELAHVAGVDPKDYLLKLLGTPRQIDPNKDGAEYGNYGQGLDTHPIDTGRIAGVVEQVASMANWGRTLPTGQGLGIAVHRSFLTTVGTVAHVIVDDNNKLKVNEIWMAVDAGLVVNPDRVKSQMEGAAIFGMSLAMHGEITAKNGAVVQGNFDTYPLVRMNESPKNVHVHIMDIDAPPGGIGEPGVPPVAPAILNAYFAATEQRIRELPLSKAGIV